MKTRRRTFIQGALSAAETASPPLSLVRAQVRQPATRRVPPSGETIPAVGSACGQRPAKRSTA